MTGKLADIVMAVRNGEQIARKYQPVVFNPNTPAQIAVRAKMKLVSQLSAVLAPYIAIRRDGSRSVRNMFTKENYKFTTYADNSADIPLTSVQLTKSVLGLPAVEATRNASELNVSLAVASQGIDRVVYVAVYRQADGSLRAGGSTVATSGTETDRWPAVISLLSAANLPLVVYAYGVRDNTDAARVAFANMVVNAQNVANVVTSRTLTETDVTLTETTSVEVPASSQQNAAPSMDDDRGMRAKKK